jgi:hypothetical protein
MICLRYIFVAVIVASSFFGFSQIENDRWSIGGDLTLPSGRGNKPYKLYLNGLVSALPRVQFKPFEHLYFSGGARYQYFSVAEFKVPEQMNGGVHSYGGTAEAGYLHLPAKRIQMQYGFRFGYQINQYITDLTKIRGAQQSKSTYLEPLISVGVISDEAVVYHWNVSYSFGFEPFKGEYLGLENTGGFKPDDFNGPTRALYVGFGISYFFGNPRSDNEFNAEED